MIPGRRSRVSWPALVLLLLLAHTATAAEESLNVSIALFDPGVPDDRSLYRELKIFPRIRNIESLLMPFALRNALDESGTWGAIRIVPEADAAAELLITAKILRSDGEQLQLAVKAVDAGGDAWLDEIFTAIVTSDDMAIYQAIADRLALELGRRDATALARIREVSMLRYGNELAPSAFGRYLAFHADGKVDVLRLPARNDPMVERIRLVRETDYVVTDAVDSEFRQLDADISSVYQVWRDYRQTALSYQATNAAMAADPPNAARGSYEAIQRLYDNYKWERLAAQEQDRLAIAFDNEVGPTIDRMEERVRKLKAWIADRYDVWHRILEEFVEVESQLQDNNEQ